MPTIGTNSRPAYVYDAETDTWIPVGPGEHTHQYIGKDVITTAGDILYASAANTPARLGIGSSGQVLGISSGIPAWTTPSSGGMTSLGTATLSGTTTTINITPTGYNYLYVDITITTGAGSTYPLFRINGDTSTKYKQLQIDYAGYGTQAVHQNTLSSWEFHIPGQNGIGASSSENRAIALIYAPNSTNRKLANISATAVNDSGYITNTMGVFSYESSSAISSISITGSNISGGTMTVYGVK